MIKFIKYLFVFAFVNFILPAALSLVDKNNPELVHVARDNNYELVKKILEQNADINSTEEYIKRTALHYAVRENNIEMAAFLIAHRANVNAKDSSGESPLFQANNCETTQLLIDSNCNVNIRSDQNMSFLLYASKHGKSEIVKLLLKNGANIKAKDCNYLKTALHYAAEYGRTEIVQDLLNAGANYNALAFVGQKKVSPLDYASIDNHAEIIKAINEHATITIAKATPQIIEFVQSSPLAKLIAQYAYEALISSYWDIVLIHSIRYKSCEDVKKALDMKANVQCKNDNKWTALHYAIDKGHFDTVKLLIDSHANANAKQEDRRPALSQAVFSDILILHALIDAKADVNGTDPEGRTALSVAADFKRDDKVIALLKERADVNLSDNKGWAPIHYAARSADAEIVKLLISANADCSHMSNDGKTPLEIIKNDSFSTSEENRNLIIKAITDAM